MVNELRPYHVRKGKKSFLAIAQGCFPLSPVTVKVEGRRNADTRTTLNLKVLNASFLERLRSVLYHKETKPEVITGTYLNWASNNQYKIFEQKRHHSPIRQIASLMDLGLRFRYLYNCFKSFKNFRFRLEDLFARTSGAKCAREFPPSFGIIKGVFRQ
jgi:hypothetical protein